MTLSDSFTTLRPFIDEATATNLAHLLARAGTSGRFEKFPRAVLASISGGKRFHALMAHVGYTLNSGTSIEKASLPHLSAALGLYQASALVHDDIIDKADERRGIPSPHHTLINYHTAQSWIRSSTNFGRHGAVLIGNFLFSAAATAAGGQALTLHEDYTRAFSRRFADMHAEVALGQYPDITAEQTPLDPERTDTLNTSDSLEMALHKSAHYSVIHPAPLGVIYKASLLDRVTDPLDVLETLLTPWGLAFQLHDDDLRVFGDPAVTGKPTDDNLRGGKRITLLALAWETSSPAERRAFTDILGMIEASPEQIATATDIAECSRRATHKARITRLVADGHTALEASTFDEDIRAMLRELCSILTVRRA